MADYKNNGYFSAEEMLKIEQLCCFLQETDLFVDDFAVWNKDCDPLGVISYYTDIEEYVFVPHGGSETWTQNPRDKQRY